MCFLCYSGWRILRWNLGWNVIPFLQAHVTNGSDDFQITINFKKTTHTQTTKSFSRFFVFMLFIFLTFILLDFSYSKIHTKYRHHRQDLNVNIILFYFLASCISSLYLRTHIKTLFYLIFRCCSLNIFLSFEVRLNFFVVTAT